MTTSFILMIVSAGSLPLLSLLAIFLRRNFFTGTLKIVFLGIGLILLSFAVVSTFFEHGDTLTGKDILAGGITALITVYILSRFTHGHSHAQELDGAKGVIISEAFHSLLDGAVIGATYLVSPVLGYAATVGIIVHELPKVIGTLTIFRSLGLSIQKTILYGIAAQIGSPVAALLIYTLGKQFNDEQFRTVEIASVSSLAAIVLWIIYLELQFHHRHDKEEVAKGEKHSHTQ